MTNTWSEQYRHQCEVRDIIAKRRQYGSDWAWDYLAKVEKARGKKARSALEADVVDQWRLGNRGEGGLWITPTVV
jgi:hypothetical protein